MCELSGVRWGIQGMGKCERWRNTTTDDDDDGTNARKSLEERAFSDCEEVVEIYGRWDRKEKPNPSGPVSFMDNVSSIFVGTVGLFYYRPRKRITRKCASSLDGCVSLRAGFGFGSKYLSIANFIVLNRCEGSIPSSFC